MAPVMLPAKFKGRRGARLASFGWLGSCSVRSGASRYGLKRSQAPLSPAAPETNFLVSLVAVGSNLCQMIVALPAPLPCRSVNSRPDAAN